MNKSNNKEKEKCPICYDICDLVEICNNGHSVCQECLNDTFQNQKIYNPTKELNTKCFQIGCTNKINLNYVRPFLVSDILSCVEKQLFLEEFEFPDNLKLVHCSLCPNPQSSAVVLVEKNNFPDYHTCLECNKKFCLYCLGAAPTKHLKCKSLFQTFKDLKVYNIYGFGFLCKVCDEKVELETMSGCAQEKISNCNHITCIKCSKLICYICYDYNINDNHHLNWKTDNKFCPKYMREFKQHEKLNEWSAIDYIAHEKFNEYKKSSLLKKLHTKYGAEKLIECYDVYKNLLNNITKETLQLDLSKFTTIDILEERIYKNIKF